MRRLVFVPLSDEMIYENPELITGPIHAFSPTKPTGRTMTAESERAAVPGKRRFRNPSARALVAAARATG